MVGSLVRFLFTSCEESYALTNHEVISIYGPSLKVEFICEIEHTKHSKYFSIPGNEMSAGSFS